jgi:flotillin
MSASLLSIVGDYFKIDRELKAKVTAPTEFDCLPNVILMTQSAFGPMPVSPVVMQASQPIAATAQPTFSRFDLIAWMAMPVIVGILGTWFLKSFLCVCKPNQVLVLAGRKHRNHDGETVGYRVLIGGRALRIPIVETIRKMDVTTIPIRIEVKKAYAKGGTPLNIQAIANVKISTDPRVIGNAIERFLGCDRSELARVAQETLGGYLRGVVATLTPEELNEDRLRFAARIASDVNNDLTQLGLQLDTLKIQSVSDDVDYLKSLGRQSIAMILRDAEMAESNAQAQAEQIEAQCQEEAAVAKTQNRIIVLEKENELRKLKAKLEQRAKSEEEITIAAAAEKKAKIGQVLETLRAEYERLRLQADEILPAEAERQAQELTARANAATIEEDARATAMVSTMLAEIWNENQGKAADLFLLNQIDMVLQVAAEIPARIHLNQVDVIDNGDGKAIASLVNVYPEVITQFLRNVDRTLGVSIVKTLDQSQ